LSSDTWLSWYWGKEDRVEADAPKLVQLFRENHVSKILDVGCGTGRHAIHFARSGFRVSGFDWSEASVKRARELSRAKKVSVDLKVWNMTSFPYPYPDASFDAVLAIKVIHHTKLATIKGIIGEVERLTRSGGFLYLQVPSFEKALRLKRDGEKSEEIEPGTFLPLDGDEKGILHHYFMTEELLSLLGGFEVVNMRLREEHYCVITRRK
jgi:SAM-dependent methyltransferase